METSHHLADESDDTSHILLDVLRTFVALKAALKLFQVVVVDVRCFHR